MTDEWIRKYCGCIRRSSECYGLLSPLSVLVGVFQAASPQIQTFGGAHSVTNYFNRWITRADRPISDCNGSLVMRDLRRRLFVLCSASGIDFRTVNCATQFKSVG